MRLSRFIRKQRKAILIEWEGFARKLRPDMSTFALRDGGGILDAIVRDMERIQSNDQQRRKSRGEGRANSVDAAGGLHATLRLEAGFDLDQLVSEFRALRASVARLWKESLSSPAATDLEDLTRFHESIDQALSESVSGFTRELTLNRDQFLGILGHDLRNPLSAITLNAQALMDNQEFPPRKVGVLAARIHSSGLRMNRMLGDLLDLTRSQLGKDMLIAPTRMELRRLCQEVFDEVQAFNPHRLMSFAGVGEVFGDWDGDRLAQALSNLLGNAMQHGTDGAPVTITLRDEGTQVLLTVHNEGEPIPEAARASVFEPMMQGSQASAGPRPRGSLGLGLFITRAVMTAHAGTVQVTSTRAAGTTFTLKLPRPTPKQLH